MSRPTIVVLPGDGIGAVVVDAARVVLDAVGFDADYVDADIGWDCWRRAGRALPQETIDLVTEHRLALLGAITSKPKREAEAELDPSLQGRGFVYRSPILELRQHFGLDVCVRPCRSFPGNPLNHVRRAPDGSIHEPAIDTVVFRQNTEGLYVGLEWNDPPKRVRGTLASHPAYAPFADVPPEEMALTVRLVTRNATERIARAAFEHAAEHGVDRVHLVDKPNVLRATGSLIVDVTEEVAAEFDGIALDVVNIDALAMWLTKNPETYRVIVADNMFGDIVSDAFAGLVGGMGFACSANLGAEVAVFEPTHGSAPKYADMDPALVNPIGCILSAAMLLEHVGEADEARAVREGVAAVVAEGRVRTFDMARVPAAEALARGCATTMQMAEAIGARLAG